MGILVESEAPVVERGLLVEDGIGILLPSDEDGLLTTGCALVVTVGCGGCGTGVEVPDLCGLLMEN